jgi:hypothetical protein
MSTSTAKQAVDKKFMYGKFDDGEKANRQRRNFQEKIAYKAADIAMDPEDDVYVEANRTGIGPAGLAGVAAAIGIPSLASIGILAYALMNQQPATPSPQPTAPVVDHEAKFDVLFYDKDGNQITVPRYSPPTTKEST